MPRTLTAVDLAEIGPAAALELLDLALRGVGDAILPIANDAASHRACAALQPGTELRDREDDEADPTALVVATSGSTGEPKGVLLQASALRASAAATHERLGGPGHWLLPLAPHHVAGVQVLVRSLLAGTTPQLVDLRAGFTTAAFASAATALATRTSGRRYTALVPTQVVRLMEAGGEALAALSEFDAVLVGGAALTPALLSRARAAGVRVVPTYGMTETCGGCVYDGVPLRDVSVDLDDSGAIRLGGPTLAHGYRLARQQRSFVTSRGRRWFATNDLGRWADGRLTVLGRADDVVISGGVKVSPQAVEDVLATLPDVGECLVVGVPDPEWGSRVVAVLTAAPGHRRAPTLDLLRAAVSQRLGVQHAPRDVVVVDVLPLRASGKPDRLAAAALAQQTLGEATQR